MTDRKQMPKNSKWFLVLENLLSTILYGITLKCMLQKWIIRDFLKVERNIRQEKWFIIC